ncbi:hypothetical protein [Rhodococcus sp. M8-33]|uniref:hypothetical protein n=1 Tax=Rhodococcus sp. M8-33 TaxID=3058377 RepID=UPI002ED1F6DD
MQHAPATKIRFGKVFNGPGYRSLPHHHGEAETGGYVLTGKAGIYFGENFSEYLPDVDDCTLEGYVRVDAPTEAR